jgi:hypothetical protein
MPSATRRCLLGTCALLLSLTSQAQSQPRAYAVISEVARQVSVVSYQPSVGNLGNNNRVQRIDVPEGALDKVFLLGAQAQLKKAGPQADIWLLAPSDSSFFGSPVITEGGRLTLPDDLRAALRERKSTHLLLFTRYRSEADIRFDNMTESTGPLEGLGYYVDMNMPVKIANASDSVFGYLAAFTHFRVSLVDVAQERVLKTMVTRASRIFTATGSKESHPWSALTPGEKMARLRDLSLAELDRMVPEVIKP